MIKRILMAFLFSAFLLNTNAQNDTCLNHSKLGISFPPVADFEQRTFTKPHLDFLNVKAIRFAENWALREPTQGEFLWQSLDDRINWAVSNGYEIMLTIQSIGPEWACTDVQNPQSCVFSNNNYFKNYMDLLVQRYDGKISKFQFGNEWQAEYWYAGNAADFIAANNLLYASVKEFSPQTPVVLGGFSTISLRFLAGCNGYVDSFCDDYGNFYDEAFFSDNCQSGDILAAKNRIDSVLTYAQYDVLDLHFYDDVEQWDEYYANFTDTISKPIIVSEFGGPNMNTEPYDDLYQVNRLFQYIKKLDSLKIPEVYYFKLVEGTDNPAFAESGLIDDTTLLEKPTYHLFAAFDQCATSVTELVDNQHVIFPNPATNMVYIVIEEQILRNAKVFDSQGILVKTIEKNNFSVSDLSNGIYIIEIETRRGNVTSKLLKK